MTTLHTNAGDVATRTAAQAQQFAAGVALGIRKTVIAVNEAAVANLGGSGAPFSYPVPVRTGHLRRSQNHFSEGNTGYVFNTARYAMAIHSGEVFEGGKAVRQSARPFLDDAVSSVDALGIMRAAITQGSTL